MYKMDESPGARVNTGTHGDTRIRKGTQEYTRVHKSTQGDVVVGGVSPLNSKMPTSSGCPGSLELFVSMRPQFRKQVGFRIMDPKS